jgi:hypothetical protein
MSPPEQVSPLSATRAATSLTLALTPVLPRYRTSVGSYRVLVCAFVGATKFSGSTSDDSIWAYDNGVLRQNSMRTENSAIPCRDGCLIQVIPSPSNAKNLSRGPERYTCIY